MQQVCRLGRGLSPSARLGAGPSSCGCSPWLWRSSRHAPRATAGAASGGQSRRSAASTWFDRLAMCTCQHAALSLVCTACMHARQLAAFWKVIPAGVASLVAMTEQCTGTCLQYAVHVAVSPLWCTLPLLLGLGSCFGIASVLQSWQGTSAPGFGCSPEGCKHTALALRVGLDKPPATLQKPAESTTHTDCGARSASAHSGISLEAVLQLW